MISKELEKDLRDMVQVVYCLEGEKSKEIVRLLGRYGRGEESREIIKIVLDEFEKVKKRIEKYNNYEDLE